MSIRKRTVDDNDEKAARLYTVIGNLHEYFPDIKTRISSGGNFCPIDPAQVFELVGRPFPQEWKERVCFRASHITDEDDVPWYRDGVDSL